MTLNDIKNDTASLLFLNDLDIDNILIGAVKRALRTIYIERGVSDTMVIPQVSKKPYLYIKNIHIPAGENVTYTLPRGTFSVYLGGVGEALAEYSCGRRSYAISTECECISDTYDEEFTLTISPLRQITVYSLFHTEEYTSPTDLPDINGMRVYHLRDINERLESVIGTARDECDRWIRGSKIISGRLYVPYNFTGNISLDFRVSPPVISRDLADEELDIPGELHHLIPCLTAYYLSLDDDEARAAHYLSLYQNNMVSLLRFGRENTVSGYVDRLGWC